MRVFTATFLSQRGRHSADAGKLGAGRNGRPRLGRIFLLKHSLGAGYKPRRAPIAWIKNSKSKRGLHQPLLDTIACSEDTLQRRVQLSKHRADNRIKSLRNFLFRLALIALCKQVGGMFYSEQ